MKSSQNIWQYSVLASVLLLSACGSPEERAQGYYDRGMALIEKKDDFAARLELLKAVKYKSDKVEAWKALAGINERVKAYQFMFDDLRRVVELDPGDIEARTKLGKMLLAGGATEAALKTVEGGGEAANKNANLLALKAAIELKMRDTSAALADARATLGLDPGNVDAATILASDKLSRSDLDGAMQILSAPAIASKDNARVEQLRSQIFIEKGNLDEAEAILRKLIKQAPQDLTVQDQLVRVFVAEHRLDEAEKELRAIVTANPENIAVFLNLVRFLDEMKGASVAKEELVSRIKGGGDVFPYQLALADIEAQQNEVGEATALLQGLIANSKSSENVLTAQAKLATLYLRQKDYTSAEKLANDILKKDQRNIAGLQIRASVRIQQGQFENAIADLREALDGQPRSPQLLLLMAQAYERDGKPELADRQYADATKSAAGNLAVALQYVAFLQRQGRTAQAEDVLADAAKANPRSIDPLRALAQLRLAQKDWTGAMATADAIKAIGNDHGVASEIRGLALAGQNKMEESVAALEAAHSSNPENIQSVTTLVTAYLRTGNADKAGALIKDMLKENPENPQLTLLMGSVQLAKNDTQGAIVSFKKVISQLPKDAAGYDALADLYIKGKNYDQASKILQQGLQEQPDNLNFKLALAGFKIEMGDYDAAIEQYEAILKEKPNTLVAINNLASLLLDYRSDKASFDRAYSLASNLKSSKVPQFEDTLGWAQYRQGDAKSAITTLEGAEAKLPNLGSIRYHLGMSYLATGQSDKAAEQLKTALQLEPDASPLKQKIRSALKQN